MCIMKTYETPRGHTVVDPPPRRGNFTSQPPAGVMRLPREWRRSESLSDEGRYVEYRRSQPRAIEYVVDEPRRSTQRVRSVSRRRVSEAEARSPRGSYVDERTRRSVSRVRY